MIKSVCFALFLIACTGSAGKDGADGTNGTNGTNGMDGADGTDGMDGMDGASGLRTVLVSPGGTTTASGTNLINALAVFKNDPTKATATNHWLIKIEPGIYDVGATGAEMQPFVDIEGSGELTTSITGTDVTLTTADGVELRDLNVKCAGTCVAILNEGGSPIISRVTAVANAAAASAAIYSTDGSPFLRDVTAIAQGVDALAIEIDAGSAFLRGVDVSASGSGATGPSGVVVFDGTAYLTDCTVGVIANPATTDAIGVYLGRQMNAGALELDNVDVRVSSNTGVGVLAESTVAATAQVIKIRDSVVSADVSIGLVDDQQIVVGTAHTQLDGDVVIQGNNVMACTADYDGSYATLVDGVADGAGSDPFACLPAP
jgi:hypothetical protein